MIKHFSKWLELVPLLSCSNETATYAFFNMVLSRLGVLAKVSFHQASLASFSPYFLLFGCEPKLLALIWQNVMVVINLDDPNV
ncbi:unnamed protein product [Sphagnum balticum]